MPRVGTALLRAVHELEPDILVISGDFTQRARREQFEAARAFLDRLPPLPRVVVPGNQGYEIQTPFLGSWQGSAADV